ncbi:hypothetical protein [Phytoactinopolyspora limicola]|uniref:hypothetical protein n=1 Tax=Phytoactinopolyspora limicola TaxID=2715536 RepID=UPI001A9C714D|nr:hypothetical protein [Phytoactinopolyspora limicola]
MDDLTTQVGDDAALAGQDGPRRAKDREAAVAGSVRGPLGKVRVGAGNAVLAQASREADGPRMARAAPEAAATRGGATIDALDAADAMRAGPNVVAAVVPLLVAGTAVAPVGLVVATP